MAQGDLFICKNAIFSHFIRGPGETIIQMDLQPFLTPSQLDGGFDSYWFKKEHFEEVVTLLQSVIKSCANITNKELKKVEKSKDCVLTGETVRIACTFKMQSEKNVCLITQFYDKEKNKKGSTRKSQPLFREVSLHNEKIVAYVCPRVSSSAIQLSQLVCGGGNKDGQQEDISKYFVALASDLPTRLKS
ncbi:unnamed protein product [Lymnaea stagnalis]|uniref:Uncharacterized protein n=1 Tax=Lymnaea stagnalis TaxID=6523 RepID=A0AAV2H5R8_LYMST